MLIQPGIEIYSFIVNFTTFAHLCVSKVCCAKWSAFDSTKKGSPIKNLLQNRLWAIGGVNALDNFVVQDWILFPDWNLWKLKLLYSPARIWNHRTPIPDLKSAGHLFKSILFSNISMECCTFLLSSISKLSILEEKLGCWARETQALDTSNAAKTVLRIAVKVKP